MSNLAEQRLQARVVSKQPVAEGVVSIVLARLDGAALPAWQPGAHIDLAIDGVPVRQYSLCGDSGDLGSYRIGVLREADGGGGSRYVHDALAEGDVISIQGPRNHFRFVPAPRYIFIAGGIGITPILPMMAAAETAGADWHLYYGGRRRGSMAYLDEVLGYGDRTSILPQDETGLLDLGAILGRPEDETLVYVCGPEPLLAAVESMMAAWPQGSLHLERFSAKPLSEPERAGSFEVLLAKSGRTLVVPASRSVLEVVEEAGIGVLSSCASGTCGTCETRVLEGVPDHRDSVLSPEEQAVNDCMMICVSRAKSDRLVLDL